MNRGLAMDTRKFIIDCDTGTDDAIALAAAFYIPGIELRALTTVAGNAAIENTSRNTLNLAQYLGQGIPVAVGAAAPLKMHVGAHLPDGTQGKSGLGSLVLPEAERDFSPDSAPELICKEAVRCVGQLEIVATGPLTNLAIAFLLQPQLKGLLHHIWVMGGAVRGGNVSAAAEFNIWCDPEAARIVFASGVPLTMVGLDVTEKAILDEGDCARIRKIGTRASEITAQILDFMFRRRDEGGEDAMMHDALALAAALCPECLEFARYFVAVDCEGTYTFGHTFVDVRSKLGREPNADVAVKLNLPLFKEWLIGCLENSRPVK